MRGKSLLLVIGVSGLLALTAWVFVRGSGAGLELRGGEVGGYLVGVPPSRVDSIEVGDASGSVRVWRHDSGLWLHESGGELWAADEGRVRAGLRVVCDAVLEGGGAEVADSGTVVRIGVSEDGGSEQAAIEFRVADVAVGGRVRVQRDRDLGTVGAELGRVLTVEGIGAWRSEQAVPWLDARVRRVIGEKEGAQVVAARVGERWALEAPVVCPGDAAGVLAWLGSVRASAEGSGRVTIEADSGRAVERWVLDGRGASLVSRVVLRDGTELGPIEFADRGMGVPPADALVSRRSVRSAPSIVARVVVGDESAERGEAGWDQSWAGDWLQLLSERDADDRALIGESKDAVAFSLYGFGGVPLESGTVRAEGADVYVWVDGVERRYAGALSGALFELIGGLGD